MAGIHIIGSQLLPPQNHLRFRTLHLSLSSEADFLFASVLVERCSLTLESLKVGTPFYGTPSAYVSISTTHSYW